MGYEAVEACALRAVGRNLVGVAAGPHFLGLAREALLELLRSDRLVVRSEQAVYEAVMGWVRHDEGARRESVGAVLSAVRMSLLPPAYLACAVSADPLVTQCNEAVRIVLEASRYSHLVGGERLAAESAGLARKRRQASVGMVVVNGGDATLYDPSTEQWSELPCMGAFRGGCATASANGCLHVLGGNGLKGGEWFDSSTRTWRALPDMSVARSYSAAACIDGLVYVVGGHDGANRLKSGERYDPSTRQWSALPDMSLSRPGCAAACVNESLYVVGGVFHKSAECYDPSTRKWQPLPDMSVARGGCAAVSMEGVLYVVGGKSGRAEDTALASAECYDPATRQWRALPAMSVARYGCAAECLEGCVYVVGGTNGSGDSLASAERYDPVTNAWSPLPSMPAAFDYGMCLSAAVEM
jgi:N-acetylneuraminic acid mutarotase